MAKTLTALVVGLELIPGHSGGWTSLHALLRNCDAQFVVGRGRPGRYVLEGATVHCPVASAWQARPGRSVWNRILPAWQFRRRLRAVTGEALRLHRRHPFDFVLCRDTAVAAHFVRHGMGPIVLDLLTIGQRARKALRRMRSGVDLVIAQHPDPDADWVRPHAIEAEDYAFSTAAEARGSVLVGVLTYRQDPCLYVRAAARSSLPGHVVGDGEFRNRVEAACAATGGRVRYLGPMAHEALRTALAAYQIGVAALAYAENPFQIKVLEYLAAGLAPVVPEAGWLNRHAPEFGYAYGSEEELADAIDRAAAEWPERLERRRAGRRFVEERFSARAMRRDFEARIRDCLAGRRAEP